MAGNGMAWYSGSGLGGRVTATEVASGTEFGVLSCYDLLGWISGEECSRHQSTLTSESG